jgi:hypothetical protein
MGYSSGGPTFNDVRGREDDTHCGQGGQREEGHRLGVRRHVPERREGRGHGSHPARLRYSVPNAATPTSRPSWFTVTTTPVASAASSTGTRCRRHRG